MDEWWTRCPICDAPTRPRNVSRWRRLWRAYLDIFVVPQFETVEVECPEHGVVKVKRLKHQPFQCQDCGYDLRGSRDVNCPECGWHLPERCRVWLDVNFPAGRGD